MSAGAFQTTIYVADNGVSHPIRVQPETITATNPVGTAGTTTSDISARVGGSRRTLGLHARGIRLRFPATGVPAGYLERGTTFIPIFTKAAFDGITKGSTFTYNTMTATVIGKVSEAAR